MGTPKGGGFVMETLMQILGGCFVWGSEYASLGGLGRGVYCSDVEKYVMY